jgi:hypothetical protein
MSLLMKQGYDFLSNGILCNCKNHGPVLIRYWSIMHFGQSYALV